MRHLFKVFVVAVGLLSIGVLSSSVSAKTLIVGTFTLSHPTQWRNTMLPAGNYTFRMTPTQTDNNLLSIQGAKKTLDFFVFEQSACATCQNGALKVAVQGDNRVVTSMDLPGYHVEFKDRRSKAAREEQSRKAPAPSEQVAVHIDPS